jgi:2-iminoacetate synthase ThiH
VAALEHAIREAGREPIQRDSYYRRVVSSQNGSATGVRSAGAALACV